MISDTLEAENNTNNIETFKVHNLSYNKSFPGRFLRKYKTLSTSKSWEQILSSGKVTNPGHFLKGSR